MLKYRLSEDTNEHFEGIEGRELTLFIIHKDISYECVISNDYDINNCISIIDQFIIKPHDDYPDVIIISYGSTTLQLLPVNLSYKQLHNEIQILKQRIYQLENAECKVPMQIPTHIPAFHALAAEIVYEHWDNLDDLLAVYPLHKYKLLIVQIYNYILPLMKKIPTFDPDDELSHFIDLHDHYDFAELTTSCKSQFIEEDKINIHMLRYIIYMIGYYNICMHVRSDVLANCYITKNTCVIKLYYNDTLALHKKQIAIIKNAKNIDDVKEKNTFRFYINDFTKCKYTISV